MSERLLLRFSKKGALKFSGHLDLLRVMQRTVRRAGLPIAYSQGFNPHQLMSFALPLPLGMESENDYIEIVLSEPLPLAEAAARLNAHSPAGLLFTGAKVIPEGTPSAASRMAVADYIISPPSVIPMPALIEAVSSLLAETSLVIPKKTKSGIRDTDIRPDIFILRTEADGRVTMRLSANSTRFLNPKTAAELILRRAGVEAETALLPITRLELLEQAGDVFRTLYGDDNA